MFCDKKPGSAVMVAINKAREALQDGYQLRLGVRDLSFWFDSYADFGPLCDLIPFC